MANSAALLRPGGCASTRTLRRSASPKMMGMNFLIIFSLSGRLRNGFEE